jgi:regulatory protein
MTSDSTSDFLKRIMQYCSLAERCTHDVVKKLVSWDVLEEDMDEILERLRQEKFLDDTRYAKSFVNDKWRLDQWGKGKIKNSLFQKGFDELQIEHALEVIDQEEYVSGMQILLSKKRNTIKSETEVQQMKKLLSFGQSRGFEDELIWQWLEREGFSFDKNPPSENDNDFV